MTDQFTADYLTHVFDLPREDYRKPAPRVTLCWLDTCRDVGHVVLYATGERLAGLQTRPRQEVTFCLRHGGEVYDVIRSWRKAAQATGTTRVHNPGIGRALTQPRSFVARRSAPCPNWLVADLRNDRLPRTSPDPSGWPPASPQATNKFKRNR